MDTSAQSLQKPLGPGVLKRRILKVPAFMPSWTQLAVSFRLPVRSVTVGSTGLGVPQGPLQFDTDWTSHGCGVTSNPYRRGRTTCPHVCERSSPSTHYTTTRRSGSLGRDTHQRISHFGYAGFGSGRKAFRAYLRAEEGEFGRRLLMITFAAMVLHARQAAFTISTLAVGC